MRKGLIILAGYAIVIGSGIYIGNYKLKNFTDIGFTKNSSEIRVNGLETGENGLEIAMNEPFQVNYSVKDEDEIKQLILYRNGDEIFKDSIDNRIGVFGTITIMGDKSGEYLYKLAAIDTKGNKREDIEKIVVSDKKYDGKPYFHGHIRILY